MSLDSVRFHGVSPSHQIGTTITLKLQFACGFHQQYDDAIFLMPVGWKTLDQRREVLRTNGSSTLAFSLDEMRGEQPDSAYQFLYAQNRIPVGVSSSFVLGEADYAEVIQEDWEFLEEDTAFNLVTTSRADGWSNPQEDSPESGVPHASSRQKDECSREEDKKQCTSSARVKPFPDQAETRQMRRPSLVLAHTPDVAKAGSKNNSKREESFVSVAMPVDQEISSSERELQALHTHALRERDRMLNLQEREKAIVMKQEEKNAELQRKQDDAIAENRKLKETLKEIESEIERIKALKIRKKGLHNPQLLTPTLGLSVETFTSGSRVQGDLDCYHKRSKRSQGEQESDEEVLDLAMARVSCQLPSLVDNFRCPICLKTFDRREDPTEFQRHVHSHFSDEDGQ